MLKTPISITALSSFSALGNSADEVWRLYEKPDHTFSLKEMEGKKAWVSQISEEQRLEVEALRNSDSKYKSLDDSVLFAIHTARKTVEMAGMGKEANFGINIGSSRGATSLFEKYHAEFLKDARTSTLASPTTTLGNISSWVGHDLNSGGPTISHSITCSSALHAVLNGVAWLQSGLTDAFLVGGSEAPLTAFTIAQMQALKIYSSEGGDFPSRAMDLQKSRNSMVLGEGAALAFLERNPVSDALALIEGIGFATETLEHNVSISTDAKCFQDSMKMALGKTSPEDVDAIVLHAPGTVRGDVSEYNAIQKVFSKQTPFLTTNKWKVGHTFGASGMMSIEMAVLMLKHQKGIEGPFYRNETIPTQFRKILVNAVGFGGNAVSILLGSTN
nr:beta-ketoacyl synthase N-terminal-like domain-containing protein [Allomuricauda sp.]